MCFLSKIWVKRYPKQLLGSKLLFSVQVLYLYFRCRKILLRYYLTTSVLLLCFLNQAYASYSDPYNKEIDDLTSVDPHKSLSLSRLALVDAQSNADVQQQLVAIFYIVESLFVLSDSDEIDVYIAKGLTLAEQSHNSRFISEFTGHKTYQQEIKGDYQAANMSANKALQLAQITGDKRLIAVQTALRGQVHMAMENYGLAMKDVETAIDIFKQHDDRAYLSIYYNLLAIIYDSLSEYDNAIKYYQESESYDDGKSPYNQAALYYNLGSVYISKKDYTKAIDYYKKSMELSRQTDDGNTLAFTNYGMAEVLMLQKKPQKAESILLSVFEIFAANNDILMLFNSNLLMADIKIVNKLYPQAQAYLEVAEKQSKVIDTPSVHLYFLKQKIEYFVAQQIWEQAFELKKQADVVRKKVQESDKKKLISELKVRFNAQFDQEKLGLLQKQNELQQASIVQEKTRQNYLWGLITLGLFVFVITYLAYRNQRKIKRYLYQLSITDYLTNVANRRHIIESLKDLYDHSKAHNLPFALVMVDLDYFKRINDTYGHEIGNEVLIYFAKTAKRVMSNVGEVGRIGGEEWLILLPNVNEDIIKNKLCELRVAYKDAISLKIPKECELSFSSGVLMCSNNYDSYEKMLNDVDGAMYKAKEKGREQDVYIGQLGKIINFA